MFKKSFLLFSFLLALLVCSVLSILFYFNGEFYTNWRLVGIVFVVVLCVSYGLSCLTIFRHLKKLLIKIHLYRKRDSEADEPADLRFEDNVIEVIEQEVDLWAKERKAEIDRLSKLERYRKEYLGNVSHELKTPIFNIQGYLMTLLDGGLEDASINRDYLQRAENSVERMIGIVDDLEAISQLETGQLELEFERFDLSTLINEIVKAEEMKATAKGIILIFREFDKPVYVNADKFRIRQVLTNLIVNSIKYGKEFGETRIRVVEIGELVRIEVADNGIGIENKHLSRLFERFYRVDKHRSREQGGTGLGLAIVKHILEAHNQSITVMSTLGSGTVFTFTLKKAT